MTSSRMVALVLGVVAEFAAVVGILIAILPGKRSSVDYLVVGTLATFIALATVFGVLMATRGKAKSPPKPRGEID